MFNNVHRFQIIGIALLCNFKKKTQFLIFIKLPIFAHFISKFKNLALHMKISQISDYKINSENFEIFFLILKVEP